MMIASLSKSIFVCSFIDVKFILFPLNFFISYCSHNTIHIKRKTLFLVTILFITVLGAEQPESQHPDVRAGRGG